jgi:hypothetical protein
MQIPHPSADNCQLLENTLQAPESAILHPLHFAVDQLQPSDVEAGEEVVREQGNARPVDGQQLQKTQVGLARFQGLEGKIFIDQKFPHIYLK